MLMISSIRKFLLVAVFAAITLAWMLSSIFNYHSSKEEVEELFDAELAQMSRMLESMMLNHIRSNSQGYSPSLDYLDKSVLSESFGHQEFNDIGHKYEKKLAFQVWDSTGKLFFENYSELPDAFSDLHRGFAEVNTHEQAWQTFTLKNEDFGFWVRVAQRNDIRTELTRKIALYSILPNLVVIPLLFILLAWIIKKGLSPLLQVSKALKGRGYQNLDQIHASDYPVELKYLVNELNELFSRVLEAAERERRFTADAAHELRTPLSITKVHLQNVLQVSDSEQVRSFVSKAMIGIDRLIHMVQQLLILSRIDAQLESEEPKPILPHDIICQLIDELGQHSDNQNGFSLGEHDIVLNNQSTSPWFGHETQLRILFRNLLDNACRYSKPASKIEIILGDEEIVIRNQCSFLSESMLEQSLERFKRGSTNQQGSGLGLSICKMIAMQNNYLLELKNRQDGVEGVEVLVSKVLTEKD